MVDRRSKRLEITGPEKSCTSRYLGILTVRYPRRGGGATFGAAGGTLGGAGLDALTGSCRSTMHPRKIAIPTSPANVGIHTRRFRKKTGVASLPKRPRIRARKNTA